MKTFNDFVLLSIQGNESQDYDCNIKLVVNGETCKAYSVTISSRELLFFTDKGTVTYMVDSYGDKHVAELFDWDFDED